MIFQLFFLLSITLIVDGVDHNNNNKEKLMLDYTPAANADQVISLPNSNSPLSSRQYSGFLNIGNNKYIHYYYIEAEVSGGLDSVLQKPLVFWTNGGPGCSGLLGLFTEFGPWRPQDDNSISRNPYTWTTEASIVFIEQPAGVGFSYTPDDVTLTNWNDYSASVDHLLTLETFFKHFPEQMNNAVGFYIASESYGGHYMPQLTLQIFENSPTLLNNFKGMLVGNPFTSYASGSIAMANVLWGLQLVPAPVWSSFTDLSCQDLSNDPYHFSDECYDIMDQLFSYVDSLNPYSLEYPTCPLGSALKKSKLLSLSSQVRYHLVKNKQVRELIRNNNNNNNNNNNSNIDVTKSLYPAITTKSSLPFVNKKNNNNNNIQNIQNPDYNPCTEIYTVDYLNRLDVQTALHVLRPNGKPTIWSVCSDPVNNNWVLSDYLADTTSLYSEIYNHSKKPKWFKMLVYSGDSDGVCATVGTQHWIYNIVGSTVKSLFEPWVYLDSTYGIQKAGFLTMFTNGLSFATVHYAGHEVPGYQPEKALELFKKYLNGSLFLFDEPQPDPTPPANNGNNNSNNNSKSVNMFFIIGISLGGIIFIAFVFLAYISFLKRSIFSNTAQPVMVDQSEHSLDQSHHSNALGL